MTQLAQSTGAVVPPQPDDSTDKFPRGHEVEKATQPSLGWRGIAWATGGIAGGLAVAWFIFFGPGESGSRSEWFFGTVVCCAMAASLYQTLVVMRQTRQDAADATAHLRQELAAAEQRTARELTQIQQMHRTSLGAQQQQHRSELESVQQLHRNEVESLQQLHRSQIQTQRELHQTEMAGQRQLGDSQRELLREQLQKQAMVDVSRAVGAHARTLATLWDRGATILRIDDRDEREQAMNPVFAQIGQVVNDFSVELSNAQLVVDDDRLRRMLDDVNAAVLLAIQVAEDVQTAVLEGREPQPNPIPEAQRLLHQRASEARHLAWELLRNRLDDAKPEAKPDVTPE